MESSKRQSESKPDDEPSPKRQDRDPSAGDDVPPGKELATADAREDEHASKGQGEETAASNELKQSATSAAALPSPDTADVAAVVGIKPGDR